MYVATAVCRPNPSFDGVSCADISQAQERRGMKILLSAYACEPDKGSEPGVGWHWALALVRRGYEVHVITRSNNREAIEGSPSAADSRLHFHYFDLRTRFWKHWPGGIYLYYLLWQYGASRLARKLHASERFDLVHHITFVSFRQPSFMGRLGIPFIFGPVGGGETMPRAFFRNLPLSARCSEMIRGLGNRVVALDPFMRRTYASARTIVCATQETFDAIPPKFHEKCLVQRAIGIEASQIGQVHASEEPVLQESKPQFLFIGRLLYWKGLHLALRALAEVRKQVPDVRLRIIGEGPDKSWLVETARRVGVTDLVDWIPHKPQHEIWQEYRCSTGFIFPSLHDSGGMVVLEALAAGLPVVCLDLGGPGSIVDSSCGFAVPAKAKSEDQVVTQLSAAIVALARNAELRSTLGEGALAKVRNVTWDAAAESVYRHLHQPQLARAKPEHKSLAAK